MNYAACTFPECAGVVTADADGQHTVKDILRTAAELFDHPRHLILGSRRFDGAVPFRSKLGNVMTRRIMRALTGQKLVDTQTGLRAVPIDFVPELLRLKATGYDFELEMLMACRHTARLIAEVPIATIYIDDNRSSHFNPLLDSMAVYFVFLRFSAVSLLTAGIDKGVATLRRRGSGGESTE